MKNRSAFCSGAVVVSGLISFTPSCTYASLGRGVAERQVLDAAVDDRRQALQWTRHLERVQARQQVPEDRLELDPRDVCAHAEVLAEAEREVGVRATIHAERERIVEDLLVAV